MPKGSLKTVLFLVLASTLLYFIYSEQGHEEFAVGEQAPAWALQNEKGEGVSLSDYKGKVVLLSFWATWCPPCIREIPSLNLLQERFSSKDFTVLGVNLDDDGWEAIRFLNKKIPLQFPIVWDHQAIVSDLYHVDHLPQSYLISRDGTILKGFSGGIEAEDEALNDLIQESLQIP